MESKSSYKSNYHFSASFIMLLGFIYNVLEKDVFGSSVFLISSVVFLSLGVIKKRAISKENAVS